MGTGVLNSSCRQQLTYSIQKVFFHIPVTLLSSLVRMEPHHINKMDNANFLNKHFVIKTEKYKLDFSSKILPIMIEIANSGSRFLWLSIEHRKDFQVIQGGNVSYSISKSGLRYQTFQNNLMDDVNRHVEKEIAYLSHENIYFLSSNSKNSFNLENTLSFFGDSTHKLLRNRNLTLPFPLWLDTNYILNFACNAMYVDSE